MKWQKMADNYILSFAAPLPLYQTGCRRGLLIGLQVVWMKWLQRYKAVGKVLENYSL